jgi:hypothetical protein
MSVIAKSEVTKQSSPVFVAPELLCGVYHRAALCADPARNDGKLGTA